MVIASDLKAAREAEERILREAAKLGYSDRCAFAIKLALEEGLNNAIKHGNGFDPHKTVVIACDLNAERIEIVITDEGGGFEPDDVPDPTADENLEKPCGRGIMLMRAYMDEVSFNESGNRLRMVKWNT